MLINIVFHPFLPIGISCLSGPKGKVLTILFISFNAICYGEIIREWKKEINFIYIHSFIHFFLSVHAHCLPNLAPFLSYKRIPLNEKICVFIFTLKCCKRENKNISFTTLEWNIVLASGSLHSILCHVVDKLCTEINFKYRH